MGKFISNYDELPLPNKRIYDLVQSKTDGTVAAFAEMIGVTQQVLDRIFKKDKRSNKYPSISKKIKDGLKNTFGLDEVWLLTGEGEMLVSNDSSTVKVIDNENDLKSALEKGIRLLPEVDFKFAAGQIELINGVESIKRYWYLPDCKDCEAIAQIAGNSMLPAYPSGCWVALKKHGFSIETATQIPFGNVFGIVVQDKFTGDYHGHIKILRRYKDQALCRKFWIAHSLNDSEYDDFDIEIAQVRSLWIVKQHIVSDVLL